MRRPLLTLVCLLFAGIAAAESKPGVSGELAQAVLTEGPSGRSAASGPVVIMPAEVAPGSILRAAASGGVVPSVMELHRDTHVLARAHRIGVRMTGATELGVFLMGIDSTVEPGMYVVRYLSAEGDQVLSREIEITEREFRIEEISLDRRLTALRRDPDPVKTAQSRELTDLILSRDPQARYHSGPLGWPMPEDSRRTSLYGDRRVFVYSDGSRARTVHAGLDLAAPSGTPVLSSGRGIVRMARDRIVTGKTVVIEHLPGVFSMYYHLDELSVAEDTVVEQGDPIGTVGATGLATGPHLHWEVRVAGVAVSPVETTEHPLVADLVPPGVFAEIEAENDADRAP